MNLYRIKITSWTSSFRYPNMISGFQPSLPVPPFSTIFGLISAAIGDYFIPKNNFSFGFAFNSKGKTVDLETIYQMSGKLTAITSNVIKREVLFDNELIIYFTQNQNEILRAFENPYFQLLLGRSGDLATVTEIKEVKIEERSKLSNLKGTLIPFGKHFVPAPIQALPIYFSNEIPRRNIGTKPFYLLDSDYNQTSVIEAKGFFDEELDLEIFWQEL